MEYLLKYISHQYYFDYISVNIKQKKIFIVSKRFKSTIDSEHLFFMLIFEYYENNTINYYIKPYSFVLKLRAVAIHG